MANLTTKSEWLKSIETSLTSVDYDYVQSSSISVVPEGLRKWNEDAYIPRKVSIGPRFRGRREDLLVMEEVKLRCMLSLLNRANKSLEQCSDAVWELDKEVRECYLGNLKLERHELAKIMLVDGCFLLELLISKGLNSQLPSRLFPPSPAAEVLKDDDVMSDLMLLENQIPFLVLHKLSQTLFPYVFEPDGSLPYSPREEQRKTEERVKKMNDLALAVLGYSPDLQLPYVDAPHILDLVHFFVNIETCESTHRTEEQYVALGNMDATQTQQKQLKLEYCAQRLLTAGFTIKVKLPEKQHVVPSTMLTLATFVLKILIRYIFSMNLISIQRVNFHRLDLDKEMELKGLDFYFKFEKDTLEIEQLHITKTTKTKWCNLIAWEHHKMYKYVSRLAPRYEDEDESEQNTSKIVSCSKFTWAALIFNDLICSADDVQLLKDKKIVVDHLKMSNQELMEFFRKIALGVDHKVVDSSTYIQMVDDINNYSRVFNIKRMLKSVITSIIYHREQVIRFMNHDYNFPATLVSVLAIVQTVYTVLAYYHK